MKLPNCSISLGGCVGGQYLCSFFGTETSKVMFLAVDRGYT
jgi:hypothetical protein